MTLGEKVRYTGGRLQLSQAKPAAEPGVSPVHVHGRDRENRVPRGTTPARFYRFCEERGIDFGDAEKYGAARHV